MKKFLAGIAAAAIITVPMTSFALESMSKGALKKATGQAGVSLALDNIVIYQSSMPTTTYWDVDGMTFAGGTIGAAGATGIQIKHQDNAQKVITLNAILDSTKYGVTELGVITGRNLADGSLIAGATVADIGIIETAAGVAAIDPTTGDVMAAGGATATNNNTTGISPLTIDVGTCQALTQGLIYNTTANLVTANADITAGATLNGNAGMNIAGVVIGLPTIEIAQYHSNNIKSIKLVTGTYTAATDSLTRTPDLNVANQGSHGELIRIEKSGHSKMAILGGRLEIAPH